jgi:hypothetical protein
MKRSMHTLAIEDPSRPSTAASQIDLLGGAPILLGCFWPIAGGVFFQVVCSKVVN